MSARHRPKVIVHRENGWMHDVKHRVSKALAAHKPQGKLFVREDLTGIRGATERVRVKERYASMYAASADNALCCHSKL